MNTAAQNLTGRPCYRIGAGLRAACSGCGARIGEPCRPPSRCTCPPPVDVFRGRASDTRPPCPVHPAPAGLLSQLTAAARDPSVGHRFSRDALLELASTDARGYSTFRRPVGSFNGRTARGRARRT